MADEPLETRLIGGVEKREIRIVDYDTDWPKKFETHARIIANALGGSALRIEHIGSTSVPGLAAKPIIDILVVVPDSADESAYLPQLEAAGYFLRVREPDWYEHRMFRPPEKDVHIENCCPAPDFAFLMTSFRVLRGVIRYQTQHLEPPSYHFGGCSMIFINVQLTNVYCASILIRFH